tara:strand:- start:352 stop:591 length:240 start_codon:yes stop_codon:yes gene_type:complete
LAGANNVIMIDKVGGDHMASLVSRPDINEFLYLLSITNPYSANLEEVFFDNLASPISVVKLAESLAMEVRIIGIKKIDN